MNYTDLYDAVIVGAGPAGLSAAIYTARAGLKVLVVEKNKVGGQILITDEVVNYPGIMHTDGRRLTDEMKRQAEAFGAEFKEAEVLSMELSEDIKTLRTTAGDFRAFGVVLATGANPRKSGFKGEKEFQGRGVAYCATCDGEFFTGMDIFVIGGGFAAVEEGIFLTRYARSVKMIVRGDEFTCARTVADEVKKYEKISVEFNTELLEAGGDGALTYAKFKNNKTGKEWGYSAENGESFGIFVFAGYVPNTEWMGKEPERNEQGYIITDINKRTNLAGVYAAGDVCVKNLRQVVTAVSDGATAATDLEKYTAKLHDKYSVPEFEKKKTSLERLREADESKASKNSADNARTESGSDDRAFISSEIRNELKPVFERFENKVIVRAYLDESPLSGEINGFMGELKELSEKLVCESVKESYAKDGVGKERTERILPSIEIFKENGEPANIAFHGVPGGHEFNSFIIALYNTAGPGQAVEESTRERLEALKKEIDIKIFVSLSCTMCPETVMSAQKAAAVSGKIKAEMFDLSHYPEFRKKYNIMSVPCMILNDKKAVFGKKTLAELADILEKEEIF